MIFTDREVSDAELPEALFPLGSERAPVEPVVRLRAPPVAEILSVRARLPLVAVSETPPAEDAIAPAERSLELVVAETEVPLAVTVPETDETFILALLEPAFRFIELLAETEPPFSVTAPAEVGLRRTLAPAPFALSEAPAPMDTVRDPPGALL